MGLELREGASLCQEVKGAAKSVLTTIAFMADDATGWCFVSQRELAELAGYCVRTVKRVVRQLVELGLIEVAGRGRYGRGNVSRYRLVWRASDEDLAAHRAEMRFWQRRGLRDGR